MKLIQNNHKQGMSMLKKKDKPDEIISRNHTLKLNVHDNALNALYSSIYSRMSEKECSDLEESFLKDFDEALKKQDVWFSTKRLRVKMENIGMLSISRGYIDETK